MKCLNSKYILNLAAKKQISWVVSLLAVTTHFCLTRGSQTTRNYSTIKLPNWADRNSIWQYFLSIILYLTMLFILSTEEEHRKQLWNLEIQMANSSLESKVRFNNFSFFFLNFDHMSIGWSYTEKKYHNKVPQSPSQCDSNERIQTRILTIFLFFCWLSHT